MEQSSEKKYVCDVYMNEVRVKDEMLPKLEEMGNLQTKVSRNP